MALLSRRIRAVAALALAACACAAAEPTREYRVKAAFLLNFAQFARWPAEAFAAPEAPLRIGVLGDDPFGRALDETLRGETVRERPIEVRRSQDPTELRDCHLVFIARSERPRLERDLAAFAREPVLTVGDSDGFARLGGVINFVIERGKVRFEINPTAAKRQQVQLDAQLLNLGRIVDGGDGGD